MCARVLVGRVLESTAGHGNGRERWWRRTNTNWQTADPDTLDEAGPALVEQITRRKLAEDAHDIGTMVDTLLAHWERDKPMTTWSRAGTHLSPAQFRAFEAGYLELVHRHAQRVDETPPGSRPVRIRWYAYPEPADEEDDER